MSLKWCDNFDLVSIGQKDGAEIITDAGMKNQEA